MVAQAIRNIISPKSVIAQYQKIDFSNKGTIPIRHLNIGFDGKEIDIEFYVNNQFATLFFATLSVFLTYGEDLVIETARHHREFIQDPILKQRVTSLIGQEAIHSKLHNEFNDAIKELEYPVDFYRFLGENFFKYVFLKFPQPLKLSLMAGIEHFTAVLAEYMMKHEKNFYYTDDAKSRALWMWHMLEESEHKDIAYDVYQVLNGNYPLRTTGFLMAFITILGLIPTATLFVPLLRKPKELLTRKFWKDARRGVNLIFSPKDGVFGSTIGQIFDYLRPDFHPNDHDTTKYLEYYKKKLLNEGGAIAPYFVKEFTPPVRAVS
ncbi:metal-dependent hydrolase [Acinetobacter baumannii]|uniref:metal-dependent hydrolase n=3 Tax=Acinetobacter baumannii TaxID=470 RepID=UPI0002BBF224|nr:metal-dependent hydrolase [Acinetobacter baumannii]EYD51106.1 putative metal-dependent hydrolase family protein [Acinetobacter baumannii 25493_4]EYS12474.1 putative metal-dependent hydrolase family protein [Acinetobacter baumannii 25569_7]EHU2136458.1 metal-dependent hydrolase [Acinetobacter baumannii]EIG0127129.1 metal-dependent hydrolase [Acinetobacter baumannii]EXE55649.1 putative metal-dependent hydrolase family protein [Acinetobacter baumannii 43926]